MSGPVFQQKLLIIFCILFFAFYLIKKFIDNVSTEDGVSKDAESIYIDKDVLGQPKDWMNPEKESHKNELPVLTKPNILKIIGIIILIKILFYIV